MPEPKPCLFCTIARGEARASIVYEDREALAFLDGRPLFPGHLLVVPRDHVANLLELPAEKAPALVAVVQKVARALEAGLGCQGSFIATNNKVSQSVPHLHFHVVPRTKGDGLKGFFWPRTAYRDAQHEEEVRQRIASAIASRPDGGA